MTSAAESFVIALARASKRGARYLRGLNPTDRDDVVSTALLACWENKATYDPSVPLDTWFMDALKTARKAFKRGNYATAEDLSIEIGVPDNTSARAEALEAATIIHRSFTNREHDLLTDIMAGDSWRNIMRTHHASGQEVGAVTRKLARLRELLPEPREFKRVLRAGSAAHGSGQSDETPIDRELARLEFPPPIGKECPPCWRCMWHQGFMPTSYVKRQTAPADVEVQAAVWRTEERKIAIAGAIQAGTWRTQ